jgi:predicted dienelactone hydrolase
VSLWLIKKYFFLTAFSFFCFILPNSSVKAAERIYFYYGPLQFSVSVDALENFAETGKVEPELAFLLKRLNAEQQNKLRDFLRSPYKYYDYLQLHRLGHSYIGKRVLNYLGELIQISGGRNGFYGIRGAALSAAASSEGLTVLNFLRQFPTDIQLNTDRAIELMREFSTINKETQSLLAKLEKMTENNVSLEKSVDFNQLQDLRQPGNLKTRQQSISLKDATRDRNLIVDLYLPEKLDRSPVIVISSGIGSHRDRFSDLAKHLASYGFVVAIPDHPGSNAERLQAFFQGLERENFDFSEHIDRPLDTTFLLNELDRLNQSQFQGEIDTQQVGVFGYSFGGATALALAGAEINFKQLEKDCGDRINLINLSLVYQCSALELPCQNLNLKDDRVKAVFIFAAFSHSIFGREGLSKIDIPVFWQALDNDIYDPLILEPIPSFNLLTTKHKYLLVSSKLPHACVTFNQEEREKCLPKLQLAQAYQSAMSTAFFEVYVAKDKQYSAYLNSAYAKAISQQPYNLSLVKSLEIEENDNK